MTLFLRRIGYRQKTSLTIFDSEPMGSNAHIHCMQPWSSRMLHALLFPIPSPITETPQIRHSVSAHPYSHEVISIFPPQHTASAFFECGRLDRGGAAFVMLYYASRRRGTRQSLMPHFNYILHAMPRTSHLTCFFAKQDGPSARYYSSSHGWPSWDRWYT